MQVQKGQDLKTKRRQCNHVFLCRPFWSLLLYPHLSNVGFYFFYLHSAQATGLNLTKRKEQFRIVRETL